MRSRTSRLKGASVLFLPFNALLSLFCFLFSVSFPARVVLPLPPSPLRPQLLHGYDYNKNSDAPVEQACDGGDADQFLVSVVPPRTLAS